jgi:hypothetical protein
MPRRPKVEPYVQVCPLSPAQAALLVELAEDCVWHQQLHSREGSHGGRNRHGKRGSFPLSDAAQSDLWRRTRDLLASLGRPVPPSGDVDDA